MAKKKHSGTLVAGENSLLMALAWRERKNPGSVIYGPALAADTGYSKTGINTITERLVKKGLVVRLRDTRGPRGGFWRYELTEQGREKVRERAATLTDGSPAPPPPAPEESVEIIAARIAAEPDYRDKIEQAVALSKTLSVSRVFTVTVAAPQRVWDIIPAYPNEVAGALRAHLRTFSQSEDLSSLEIAVEEA